MFIKFKKTYKPIQFINYWSVETDMKNRDRIVSDQIDCPSLLHPYPHQDQFSHLGRYL